MSLAKAPLRGRLLFAVALAASVAPFGFIPSSRLVNADEPKLPPPPIDSGLGNPGADVDSLVSPAPPQPPLASPEPRTGVANPSTPTEAPTAPLAAPDKVPVEAALPPPPAEKVEKANAPEKTEAKAPTTPPVPAPAPQPTTAAPSGEANSLYQALTQPKSEPSPVPPPADATPDLSDQAPAAAEMPVTPPTTPDAAAEPTPASLPEPTHDDASRSSTASHRNRIPEFTNSRPQWAVELTGSPSGLGTSDIAPDFTGNPTAFDLHFEFQPAILQSLGVFGMGPTAGLYMFPQDQGIATQTGVWMVGWEFRYQARFFHEQILVPVIGYAFERIAYHFTLANQNSGTVTGAGPIFGLWLLLNALEPSEAEQLFKENGVSRSYLVVEARDLSGSDDYLNFSGPSLFFGLRIEF